MVTLNGDRSQSRVQGARGPIHSWTSPCLIAIVLLAVSVRMIFGLLWASRVTLVDSYYGQIALDVLDHKGLTALAMQDMMVERMPLYPLFLVTVLYLSGISSTPVLIAHALLGGGITLLAFLLGQEIHDLKAGLLSAFIVALYPYYVGNNIGLTDEPLLTLNLALLLLLVLKLFRKPSLTLGVMTGLMLGLALLTRASVLPFVPLLFLWLCFFLPAEKWKICLTVFASFIFIVLPWLIINYQLLGRPTLTGHTGFPLWNGNNPALAKCGYPEVTIDFCEGEAARLITAEEWARLDTLSYIERDDEMARKAFAFIVRQPRDFLANAFLKLKAGYSWNLNPVYHVDMRPTGPWWKFAGYTWTYLPLCLLAVIGVFASYPQKRPEIILIGFLYLSFSLVFMLFWAHTAHRSPLDIYMIIFSSYGFLIFHARTAKDSLGEARSDVRVECARDRNPKLTLS